MRTNKLFTIDPSDNFGRRLAKSLLDGSIFDDIANENAYDRLPNVTILVQNYRSVKTISDAIIATSRREAVLLARIIPFEAIQDDELILSGVPRISEQALAIPPALDQYSRLFAMCSCLNERGMQLNASVIETSKSMLQLIDELESATIWESPKPESPKPESPKPESPKPESPKSESPKPESPKPELPKSESPKSESPKSELPKSELHDFNADGGSTSKLFNHCLAFDRQLLARKNSISANARRQNLLKLASEYYARHSTGYFIVAGSTASRTGTRAFIRRIIQAERTAVVLPGLAVHDDTHFSDSPRTNPYAQAPHHLLIHGQYSMMRLVRELKCTPAQATNLSDGKISERQAIRQNVIHQAMRSSQEPPSKIDDTDTQLTAENYSIIACETQAKEAEAVALHLARKAKIEHKSTLLVSPSVTLTRMITHHLRALGVAWHDSAGEPLANSSEFGLVMSLLRIFRSNDRALTWSSLLNNPHVRLGRKIHLLKSANTFLDSFVFRNSEIDHSLDDIIDFLKLPSSKNGNAAALLVIESMHSALAPFDRLSDFDGSIFRTATSSKTHSFRIWDVAAAILEVINSLTEADRDGDDLWSSTAAKAITQSLEEIALPDREHKSISLPAVELQDFFAQLLKENKIPQDANHTADVTILGTLEARLSDFECITVCGMNERQFPRKADPQLWLDNASRNRLDIDTPELTLSRSAHDFVQLASKSDVTFSYSRFGGTSSLKRSRWLDRLECQLGRHQDEVTRRGSEYVAIVDAKRFANHVVPVDPPRIAPALSDRPLRASITDIEKWLNNPYDYYASRIARLRPLSAIDYPPVQRDLGNILHRFAQLAGDEISTWVAWPQYPADELTHLEEFVRLKAETAQRLPDFWRFKFTFILDQYLRWEESRRGRIDKASTELQGRMEIPLATGDEYQIFGKADRVEVDIEGQLSVIDFKTGSLPKKGDVKKGTKTQLLVELAMAKREGFAPNASGTDIFGMEYVNLKFGSTENFVLNKNSEDFVEIIDKFDTKLLTLLNRSRDASTIYNFTSNPSYNYQHLARADEWLDKIDD